MGPVHINQGPVKKPKYYIPSSLGLRELESSSSPSSSSRIAMDTSNLANNPQLLQYLNQQKEKAMVNEMVAKLTSKCWDKCVTDKPGSKFSSSELTCLSNCAQRYMDMSLIIMKKIQQQ